MKNKLILLLWTASFYFFVVGFVKGNDNCIEMGKEIGELGEHWQFPSDHLPVGISLENQDDQINIMTWNILNNCYMSPWVNEMNTQGLVNSMITDLDKTIYEDSKLTRRDIHVIDLILDTLSNSSLEKDFICLQECSIEFLQEIETKLPKNYSILFPRENMYKNQISIIYCSNKYKINYDLSCLRNCIFSEVKSRYVMDIVFQKKDLKVRIINTHLPFTINKKAREGFIQFLYETQNSNEIDLVIGLGDLNCTEIQLKDQVTKTFKNNNCFVFSPYPTLVYPKTDDYSILRTKALDHILILNNSWRKKSIPIDDLIQNASESLMLLK